MRIVILGVMLFANTVAMAFDQNHLDQLLTTMQCSQCNLSHADLSNKNFARADFSHANLKKTQFSQTKLKRAWFPHAKMQSSNLQNAYLRSPVCRCCFFLAVLFSVRPRETCTLQ